MATILLLAISTSKDFRSLLSGVDNLSLKPYVELTWKAFGGYTHDLGSFGEETDKNTTLHRSGFMNCSQSLETASQFLATPSDHTRDGIKKLMTASEHSRLKRNPRRFGEATTRTIDQSVGGKLRDRIAKEFWALFEDLAFYDNESWNDPRDFAKPVKVISLPQDVLSTFDRRLIELENQVQRLMEAYLAPKSSAQVNKIASSCEICNGPYDTQYFMENLEQAFVDYASSRIDEAGGKWFTFKPEQNNLGDTYNPSRKNYPNLRWTQLQNSQNNFSNPPNHFQPNGSFLNRFFNNNPENFNNQSNLEGLVSNFMASQDARLSKFEADFKQQ
ncbi:hypothetical protein Tco_0145940 [Tanacetum coccineum]